MRTLFVTLALLSLIAGCGGGNIGDLFSIFPADAFEDPMDGGDNPGGGFTPAEVASLGGSQGVAGDVRNIVVASVDQRSYAFVAAGTTGVHVIDVTDPDLVDQTDVITTIRAAVLTAPAALAGGRVDALVVVDGFLVCLAVGTTANGVSVFNLEALIAAATSTTADVSGSFIAPADAGIPVPGTASGDGGGVSGVALNFFVADGGPTLKRGIIDPAAGTWSTATEIVTLASVVQITDVQVNNTLSIYASVRTTTNTFGIVTLGNPLTPAPVTPVFSAVESENFDEILDEFVVGPGTYPLDLALDGISLFVTGQNRVSVFNVANPIGPSLLSTLDNTGPDTIAADVDGDVLVIGAGDRLQIAMSVIGQTRLTGQVTFGSTFTIRGVALHATTEGNFALCCAGTQGLRIVQLSQTAP